MATASARVQPEKQNQEKGDIYIKDLLLGTGCTIVEPGKASPKAIGQVNRKNRLDLST